MSTNHKRIFAIKDRATGEFVSQNGRVAWGSCGNAQNAMAKLYGENKFVVIVIDSKEIA